MLSVVPSSAASTALTTGNSVIYAWTGDGLALGDNGVYKFSGTAGTAGGRGLSTGLGVSGIANTVTIQVAADAGTQTTDTTTAVGTSSTKRAILTVTGGTFVAAYDTANTGANGAASTGITFNTAGTQAAIIANNELSNVVINTPTAGEVVVKVYRETAEGSGLYSSTAYETVTFTIGSAAVNGVYASSKVYAEEAPTGAGAPDSTTDDAFKTDAQSYRATASTTAKAAFLVSQYDAVGVKLPSTATKAVTITTTIGAVGTAETSPVGSYVAIAGATSTTSVANDKIVYLFSDGRSGKAVVTIAVNGVTAATYNVTFYSTTIASMTLTPYKNVIATGTTTAQTGGNATATNDAGEYYQSYVQFILVVKDANGNENTATAPSVTVSSSNIAVATVSAPTVYSAVYGGWLVNSTAVSAGTTTVTIKDSLTGLIAVTGTVTVGSKDIASLTMTTDAADYKPGDKVTVTLTAKDADGKPIADGVYYNLLTGAVASTQSLVTYPFGKVDASIGVSGALCSGTAPTNAGSTGECGNGYDAGDVSFKGGVATATFYAPQANFKLTASATVTNAAVDAANAATDAAAEAVDAANAATDAANAAAEAADAATAAAQDAADAVAALATSVEAMVSSLKKQITALTNLVIKIQKKVKA
jgi:hypothetical protein